jgi:hypothetical protein
VLYSIYLMITYVSIFAQFFIQLIYMGDFKTISYLSRCIMPFDPLDGVMAGRLVRLKLLSSSLVKILNRFDQICNSGFSRSVDL